MPLWQGYESGLGVGRVRSPPSFFELNPHLKVVPENDYEVVQVYVSAPHQGDTARAVYIEQQFNECVDLPPWQFKNGFIKVGPFEILKGLRMEKRLHYLPPELLCGGVPLNLIWTLTVFQITEAGEEAILAPPAKCLPPTHPPYYVASSLGRREC